MPTLINKSMKPSKFGQEPDDGFDAHVEIAEMYLTLIEIDSEEKIICAIKKHPVGLFIIYATGLLTTIATLSAASFLGFFISDSSSGLGQSSAIGAMIIAAGGLLTLVILFFTYVSGFIYQNNVLIITTDKIAQVLYKNLIDRKISQLSLGELQDITVDQKGVISRLFKYGTLVIETAGEQNNYNFVYSPYPYHCAKALISAHEQSIKRYGN